MPMMDRRKFIFNSLSTSLALLAAGKSKLLLAQQLTPAKDLPNNLNIETFHGLTVKLIDQIGMTMSDGYKVPGKPDGMGVFQNDDGHIILMRNHELDDQDEDLGPYKSHQGPTKYAINRNSYGGVTKVILDKNLNVLSSHLALEGSMQNCSGGVSPWGWLSCEETTQKGHGYVYLCPYDGKDQSSAKKIPSYGRFNHEAVAIDPQTLTAYLTEDRGDSCLYRFVPHNKNDPFKGDLQALVIKKKAKFNTSKGLRVSDQFDLDWVSVQSSDSRDILRKRAQKKGAAIFSRGEGIAYWNGKIFFTCTDGGDNRDGQVFVIDIKTNTLTLLAESTKKSEMNMPDNICVSSSGTLFFAEDCGDYCHIKALTQNGTIIPILRNKNKGKEIAGVCFSPDEKTLFANLQKEGATIAITGDFSKF
jgi:secreted PhoX family phosphatase